MGEFFWGALLLYEFGYGGLFVEVNCEDIEDSDVRCVDEKRCEEGSGEADDGMECIGDDGRNFCNREFERSGS